MSIGVASTENAYTQSVFQFRDILQNLQNDSAVYDTSLDVKAPSAASALITLVLNGAADFFENNATADFSVDLDDLVSIHFLDSSRYETMISLIESGLAYKTETDSSVLRLDLTSQALDLCSYSVMPGDFSCVSRKMIQSGVIKESYAVHDFSVDNVQWLQDNVLGVSNFAASFASNFSQISQVCPESTCVCLCVFVCLCDTHTV